MSKQQSASAAAAAAASQKLITSYYAPLTSFPALALSATNNSAQQSSSLSPVKCVYCMSGLDQVWIVCAQCDNFHLCLKCFSMSAEIGEHRKDHNYYVKSTASFPIFDGESLWTYKEELVLLQNIEQYGFGNWEDIAKHMPNRTPQDCMQHYYSYYIYGNLGKSILNHHETNGLGCPVDQSCDTLSSLSLNGAAKKQIATKNGGGSKHTNHSNNMSSGSTSSLSSTTTTAAPLSHLLFSTQFMSKQDQLTVLLPPVEMSLEEQRALGYMPLRDDYEREYKNDAESLISNVMLSSQQLVYVPVKAEPFVKCEPPEVAELNEEQLDYELKLNLIDIYRERLKDRVKYKKIARDYGLVNSASALINNYNKYLNGLVPTFSITDCTTIAGRKKKQTCFNDREMTELNDKMKKFVQFMSVSEYETLLSNLRRQRQLYNRLASLRKCRTELGMRTLAEMDEYARAKQQRKLTKPKRFSYLLSLSKRVTRGVSSRNQSPVKSSTSRRRHRRNEEDEEEDEDDDDEDDDEEDDEIDELAMMASPSKRRRRSNSSALNHSINNGHSSNNRSSTRKNGLVMATKPARAAAAAASAALNGTINRTPSRNLRGRRSTTTNNTPVKNSIKYDDDIYDDEDDDEDDDDDKWEEDTLDDNDDEEEEEEESEEEEDGDDDEEEEEEEAVTGDEESVAAESVSVQDDSTTLSSSNDCAVVYQVNEDNMSGTSSSSTNRPPRRRNTSRTPVKASSNRLSPVKKKTNGGLALPASNGSSTKVINKKKWSLSNGTTKKKTDKKKKKTKKSETKRSEPLYSINGKGVCV